MIGMICDAVVKLSMVIIHGYPRLGVVPDMGTLRRGLFAQKNQQAAIRSA
jgi:hypothetical protein